MPDIERERAALSALEALAWPDYLDAHSGLPGPRANLELVVALAEVADPVLADELIASGDEFRTMCAAAALGRRADDPAVAARLRGLAGDERWRVREGVAMGLQMLGDREFGALEALVLAWADDPDPLVQRAAAAAICEPRLLTSPAAAAAAVEVCRRTTGHLVATEPAARREAPARKLRQALGYCWSVAIAADPGPGLAAFSSLDAADPDVAWIIAENRRKKRLASLL